MRSYVILPSMLVVWISVFLHQAHSSPFTSDFFKGPGANDGHRVSRYATKLFEKCRITDPNEQVSILKKGMRNFNEKIISFDPENMEPGAQSWSLYPTESKPTTSTSPISKSVRLSKFSLKRQKGYIVFEDGENDDYLQNYLGYLYDDRIPEMIIICRGYSKLRMKMCKTFWEIISNEHQCEIPQILMGAQGKKEIQLFDIMEGVGVIEESERQSLMEASLDFKQREIEAQKTYQLVTNHILTLNKVSIALKTAPTDLYEIIKRLGLKVSREKMIIGWASPAGFVENPTLHLFSKFNFEQDYEASYGLIASGIPMYLTGKSLSDTRTKSFIAKEHVIKMRKVDKKFNEFDGFENLIETFKSAPVGHFLHLYLNMQRGFQNARVYFAKKTIEYLNELSNKNHSIKEIKVDQEAVRSKFAIEYFEKVKEKLKTRTLENNSNTGNIESKIEKLKQRHEKNIKRWGTLFEDEKYFVEGCIADPHLEFILNSTLRKESVKEIIPVKLSKKRGDDLQHDIEVEIKPDSNCWLLSGVDDTHFVEILQDFINQSNKNIRS